MRPPHGCRCCGRTGTHDDDCLVPALAQVVVERDRLRALICEWDAAEVAHAEALTRLMKGYAQTSQKWKGTVRRRDAANAALAGEVKP